MQSVSITTNIESLNPVHGDMYSIQHYVIKFLNDLLGTPISFTYKTDRHDITDILLKVALNSLNLYIYIYIYLFCVNRK